MKPLVAVDGWVTNDRKHRGKYRNEKGLGLSGFYRRDYKHFSEMVVLCNGHSVCRYKYPRGVNIPFRSPMVRWFNLAFCGGYSIPLENGEKADSNDRLLNAVREGKKPIGFWPIESDDLEETIQKLSQLDLIWNVRDNENWVYQHKIGVANKGKVSDHFDLNQLIESYRLFSERLGFELLTKEEENLILNHNDLELSSFLNGFDHANPKKRHEYVLTGLILGYPIESTVALLTGQIY